MRSDHDQMIDVITAAGAARGRQVSDEALVQYTRAFSGTDPKEIEAAFFALFQVATNKDLPAPGAILEQVRRTRAKSRGTNTPDVAVPDADRNYAAMVGSWHDRYFAGQITRDELYRGYHASARAAGIHARVCRGHEIHEYNGRTLAQVIDIELGSYRGDHSLCDGRLAQDVRKPAQTSRVEQGVR